MGRLTAPSAVGENTVLESALALTSGPSDPAYATTAVQDYRVK